MEKGIQNKTDRKTKISLLIFLIVLFVLFCIHPPFPNEIFLQHIATVLIIGFLIYITAKNNLSNKGFLCIILFLVVHIIGARWNYSFTPYDKWTEAAFDFSINDYFGFTRNNYDRLVHFMYGLLMIIPVSEIYNKWFKFPKKSTLHIAFLFVLASSMIYESLEWLISVFMSSNQAQAYNGQQGDFWDAQKDMAIAMLGALLMIMVIRVIRRKKDI